MRQGRVDEEFPAPSTATALHARTVPERIADRILAAMAVGVLQPGERLPSERDLARMLEVSRTTVRQALGRLSALGVTECRRGRAGGTFAVPPHATTQSAQAVLRTLEPMRRDLESLFDYRSLVEQLIAHTAARRHTAADDEAMQAALARYRHAHTAAESRQADRTLHAAISAAARNTHLAQLAQELVTHVNLGFTTEPYSDELHARALQQHIRMVEAITAGQSEHAATLAAEHFQMTTGDAWRSALSNAAEVAPNQHPSSDTHAEGR